VRILVDRLDATPKPLCFAASPQGCDEPLEVRLKAHCIALEVFLEGQVSGSLLLVCGRCLTRYRAPIREPFRLVLVPAGTRVPADPEGAAALAKEGLIANEDLEAGWYQGSEIHLDRFIQELVALALPVQPVCREDCRGLCPHCGVDRNQEACDCSELRAESPFAALAELRGALASGRSDCGPSGGDQR